MLRTTDTIPPPLPSEIVRLVEPLMPRYSSVAPLAIEKLPVPKFEFVPRFAIVLPLIALYMPFAVFWMRAHFVKARVKVHVYPDGSHALFHGPRCIGRYDEKGALKDSHDEKCAA